MVIRKCRGYEVEITNEFAYFFDHTGTDFQVNKKGEIFYLDPSLDVNIRVDKDTDELVYSVFNAYHSADIARILGRPDPEDNVMIIVAFKRKPCD